MKSANHTIVWLTDFSALEKLHASRVQYGPPKLNEGIFSCPVEVETVKSRRQRKPQEDRRSAGTNRKEEGDYSSPSLCRWEMEMVVSVGILVTLVLGCR